MLGLRCKAGGLRLRFSGRVSTEESKPSRAPGGFLDAA